MTTTTKCSECGRRLPADVPECPGCLADAEAERERERRRKIEEDRRRQLGPAPLSRSVGYAHIALASAAESIADALRFADEASGYELRQAAEHVARARTQLGRAGRLELPAEWRRP